MYVSANSVLTTQFPNRNLLGPEQVSAGGSKTVRGYEENEVVGDNASHFSQEILLLSDTPAVDVFRSPLNDSLRAFLFYGYARTWNTDKLPGENIFKMHSVILSFKYQLSQYEIINFAYG